MNFSEFKQKLGAEPRQTAETYRAGETRDAERDAAVAEAESLEDRLEAALRLPVDEDALLDSVLAASRSAQGARTRRPPTWLAVAAGLVLVVGVAALVGWLQAPPETVEDYVQSHYRHDGSRVLARAGEAVDRAEIEAVLASVGVRASDAFSEQVRFIKFCPTPHSQGAHMIVDTAAGPVTVIYMPAVELAQPVLVRFDDVEARVVALTTGAAAIIGPEGRPVEDLQSRLREGIRPLSVDA